MVATACDMTGSYVELVPTELVCASQMEGKEERVVWGWLERTYHRTGCKELGNKPTEGPLGYAMDVKTFGGVFRYPCQVCKPPTGKYHFMWWSANKEPRIYHWKSDCEKLLMGAKSDFHGEQVTASILGEAQIDVTKDMNFCDACRPKKC